MPNWCDNRATISGPSPVIDEIKQILKQENPNLLSWMVPQPNFENDQAWYQWNIDNWGTKWDIDNAYISDESESDSVTFSFATAWAPPVTAFETWAMSDGRVQFTLDYFEPGMAYVGKVSYDGEYIDEEHADSSTDPAEYARIALDDWGWEDDEEEPEPFTEWYEQGIEDKGLDK